jgi:hypothetical protein
MVDAAKGRDPGCDRDPTAARRMERAGVQLTSTTAVIAELVRNWASPAGAVAFPLLT